ncbi:MAG TPA: 2-dehydropantoate 2-reductase [Solirubrobacteraceae bacterium]|nr:2-dehydropantoate 2-reductase [Solirubrobacteraceae bacterium]
MRVAVLGPGGVGGLLAGALERAGEDVTVIARESTAEVIAEEGLRVGSVTLGEFIERPRTASSLQEPVDALIVATKAAGLEEALQRIAVAPPLVLPLLNGLDHIVTLRERFAPETVLAGTIRVEADRPEPGVIVHTSPFLLVEMASRFEAAREGMAELAQALEGAGVRARGDWPISERAEAQVMWSKLVRLNALACTTSAHDKLLGEIRSTPALRADLVGAIEESCAVGQAEGADDVDPQKAIDELERAHDTLGSSMQRDIAAGRTPEVDAIPGSVLRAAARHRLSCPTIERLVAMILARAQGLEVS